MSKTKTIYVDKYWEDLPIEEVSFWSSSGWHWGRVDETRWGITRVLPGGSLERYILPDCLSEMMNRWGQITVDSHRKELRKHLGIKD